MNFLDPSGEFLDIIADIGFIGYDVYDIGNSIYEGNGVSLIQLGALGADMLGAVVPFVTGGGVAVRGSAKLLSKTDDAAKTSKFVDDTIDPVKNRVKLRKGTKETIQENAPKTKDGKYIDPNTGNPIEKGQEVYGHKTGQEWNKYKKDPANKGKNRKEVIEDQNDPNKYQIEDRRVNSSHKYEEKKKKN